MRAERAGCLVVVVGVLTPFAAAQGFGDRGDGTAVHQNSEASVNISGFAGGAWRTLNSDGRVSVPVSTFDSPVFYSIGEIDVETGSQTDMVEVAWWELPMGEEKLLQFVYRTEDGEQFVPFGSKEGGSLIQAFTYEMGADGNGVDFRNWVDSAFWTELTISYSYDGGQTVFSDPKIFDPAGTDPWNGNDAHHLGLALPGDGVNWIQATYTLEVVPAPATAALLAPGVLLFRRRR